MTLSEFVMQKETCQTNSTGFTEKVVVGFWLLWDLEQGKLTLSMDKVIKVFSFIRFLKFGSS